MKETAEVPLRILVFRPTSRIPFAGNSLFEKETLLTLMPSQPQVFPGSDLLGPPRPRPPSAGALLEHAALGPARADRAAGRPIAAPQLGIEPCHGARREKRAEYLK